MKNNCLKLSYVLLPLLVLVGCGKFGPPLPPEVFSPKAVDGLSVSADDAGVKLSWNSPDRDVRGDELRSLDGYLVQRREISAEEDTDFETLETLPDVHLAALKEAREELRAKGLPTRRAKVSSDLTTFEYLDTLAEHGKNYLYKVVPTNQGGVEGEVLLFARVSFAGAASRTALMGQGQDSEPLADPLGTPEEVENLNSPPIL